MPCPLAPLSYSIEQGNSCMFFCQPFCRALSSSRKRHPLPQPPCLLICGGLLLEQCSSPEIWPPPISEGGSPGTCEIGSALVWHLMLPDEDEGPECCYLIHSPVSVCSAIAHITTSHPAIEVVSCLILWQGTSPNPSRELPDRQR